LKKTKTPIVTSQRQTRKKSCSRQNGEGDPKSRGGSDMLAKAIKGALKKRNPGEEAGGFGEKVAKI